MLQLNVLVLLPLLSLLLPTPAQAVDHSKFKSCSQSGFCRRLRSLADANPSVSPYSVSPPSYSQNTGILTFDVKNAVYPAVSFELEVSFLSDGAARVKMDEVNGLRQRYNETAVWALQGPLAGKALDPTLLDVAIETDSTTVKWIGGKELKVTHNPLRIAFSRGGVEHIVVNEKNLLNMEHFRVKPVGDTVIQDESGEQVVLQDNTPSEFEPFLPHEGDGSWEEDYGGKHDPKPKGPEALSIDITFPGYEHVYGIPEHASSLALKTTRGGEGAYDEPYRLYNLDVFEYEADSPMALYGSVPFLQAHRPSSTVGVFLLSGSETWIDIIRPKSTSTHTHWMAESGTLDLIVFLGPESPVESYTGLTGRVELPQYFALGYHQCRWNYQSEEDVLEVMRRFDESDIPLDVMWLDIEYAHEHEYFIWDRRYFPTPEKMQASLSEKGRKLVAIVDPHIKRDPELYIYTEAQELDILSKTSDGKEFEGWCWTGSSAWTDWFHPKSWAWWIGQFTFEKFKGSTKDLFIWNDMNEPSIFNGPEVTMQKDAVHYGGWEHRDVHNIGGMIYQNVTAGGLVARQDPPQRPFVLTRAFFAGSQRFGAHWTGDNLGTWAHLASATPMFLTSGISGLPFVGADVGGFFGNPSPEMMVRWYQLGSVSPFFRAHGHIDTKRREPYLYEQPIQSYLRDSVRFRYTLMPALYTAFHEAVKTGVPILRPQFLQFPKDKKGFAIDDQFYFGNTGLLVKPVVNEGQLSTDIYVSDHQPYYHYKSHDIYFGPPMGGITHTIPAPLDELPILMRGGSILPRRDVIRRASSLSWKDDITLVIAVDRTAVRANGTLYLDDGESYAHERGEFIHRGYGLTPDFRGDMHMLLWSRSLEEAVPGGYDPQNNTWAQKLKDTKVRRIEIYGLAEPPTCIKMKWGHGTGYDFTWTPGITGKADRKSGGTGKKASKLVIHDLDAPLIEDWRLILQVNKQICDINPAPEDLTKALQSRSCPAGQFQCRNKGHTPSCILVSRVNDGVCDPECCDGSDETDGKADCKDVCAEVAAIEKKKADEEARKRRVGAAVRSEYILHGAKEKRKLEEEIATLESKVAGLKEREAADKIKLEELESVAAEEIERKKNSVLFEKIVEMQNAIKALRAQRAALEGHVSELSEILGDLSRDFNPNYQDMAVLGASRAYKDWRVTNGLATADSEEGDKADAVKPEEEIQVPVGDAPDISDADLTALESEDPLSLIDSINVQVGKPGGLSKYALFKIEDYLPESWRPQYNDYRTRFLSLLSQTGIIQQPAAPVDSDRPELVRARAAHQESFEAIEKSNGDIEKARRSLEQDWGRDWEWKKLDGTCVEKDTGEYTYSVCFFGEASQKSNSNNGKTSLGKFSTWSTTADAGTDAYYAKHVYDNGQRCWNGPLRSAKVDFICGTQNALISVVEPEKCEYLFTVTTPAICYPLEVPKQEGKDEL